MPGKTAIIQKLTERNDELENYFRNTIIPQLFVDEDFILRKFTPPAMKQFTLTKSDIGKNITDIKENFRFESIEKDIHEVLKNGEILEKDVQTSDHRWYQMNVLPYVEIKSRKRNGVIITFVETTARMKDLKDMEGLLAEHETLLDIISHDLKGPLTSLLLALESVDLNPSAQKKNNLQLIKIVKSSVSKMQHVVTELTDTRKQEHKYNSEQEVIDIEEILQDVHLTVTDSIAESCPVIKSELNVKQLVFSRRKFRSILYNLVSNAIKFKSPKRKSKILVSTSRAKGYVIITVKDNGLGIASGKKEAVFSKYFRIENHIEGTGIGLYLVKEIVQNAGGKVELKSAKGRGSEFKIYLKQGK